MSMTARRRAGRIGLLRQLLAHEREQLVDAILEERDEQLLLRLEVRGRSCRRRRPRPSRPRSRASRGSRFRAKTLTAAFRMRSRLSPRAALLRGVAVAVVRLRVAVAARRTTGILGLPALGTRPARRRKLSEDSLILRRGTKAPPAGQPEAEPSSAQCAAASIEHALGERADLAAHPRPQDDERRDDREEAREMRDGRVLDLRGGLEGRDDEPDDRGDGEHGQHDREREHQRVLRVLDERSAERHRPSSAASARRVAQRRRRPASGVGASAPCSSRRRRPSVRRRPVSASAAPRRVADGVVTDRADGMRRRRAIRRAAAIRCVRRVRAAPLR